MLVGDVHKENMYQSIHTRTVPTVRRRITEAPVPATYVFEGSEKVFLTVCRLQQQFSCTVRECGT
jgi:hypothetical protein